MALADMLLINETAKPAIRGPLMRRAVVQQLTVRAASFFSLWSLAVVTITLSAPSQQKQRLGTRAETKQQRLAN